MGNADSNAYRNHLSRFLPEEQSDIDGVFDAISGSSGSSAAKNGKATKKTVTLGALQAHVALSESPSETAVPPVTVPPSVRTTLMCQAAAVNSAAAEINGTFTADVNSSRVELSTLDLTLYVQQQALTSNRNVPGGFDRSGIEPAIDGVRSSRGVVMYDGVHKLAFNSKGQPCNLNKQSLISTSGMPYKTQAYMREPLPEQMTVRLYNGMKSIDLTGKSSEPSEQIAKEQFVIFMSNLLKGNADEKITIIMRMISTTEGPVKGKQIQEFTEDLIMSVVHVLNYRKELKGWNLENTRDSAGGVKALASQLLSELKLADGATPVGPQLMEMNFDQSAIEDWVYRVPHISTFLSVVIRQGLHVLHSLPDQTKEIVNLVPGCKGIKGRGLVSLFDIPSIIYINSHLPAELQHKWRLLFSSRLHGESFSQLCGHIVNKGPCIVILRDFDGYIFGGFASHSWEVKPQFQGDNRCFLFSVFPSLAVYTYTGYNDHYMYLNHNQQTMPNGLGMGGQHDYFGLWVDSDYGKGHSKAKPRCTTYNSPQLSAKENFTLDALEVWAVGDLPESTETKGKKSILDVDPEAQALLEMVGKSRQSEGLREPIEDDEDN